MDPERWQRLEALFEGLIVLPREQREAFVASQTAGDSALAGELRALADAHDGRHPLLDSQPAAVTAGTRIGPYAVERILGSGGMGTVYLACRADRQFEKHVAIKLIPTGLAGSLLAGRFHDERQILASLDHPNVARLLDAGVTEFGQPYLVMDYIDGPALDVWCDQHPAPIAARLDQWSKIAAAVSYAHRNLVIHRDLKPGNILVDAAGEPKLVDFGIAKLLDSAEAQAQTMTGANLLTPLYASPEQLRGEKVTTATDIYSLGVILYRMLTGEHPFRREGQAPLDWMNAVQHTAPAFPKELPLDLRAIAAKAMEKDPQRRYHTVDQFLDDVERYRQGETVLARPPTLSYRAARFMSRHRLVLSLASLTILAIAGFAVAAMWQARKAARERARAEQVTAFLTDLLAGGRNYADLIGRPSQVRVADLVDRASQRLGTELADQPEVELQLRRSLGTIYLRLGRLADARRELERSLALARRVSNENDPRVLHARMLLGVLDSAGGKFPAAERTLRDVRARWRSVAPFEGRQMNYALGVVLFAQGKLEEAGRVSEEGLALVPYTGAPDPERGLSLNGLGLIYVAGGKLERAAAQFGRCIDESRAVSPPPDALAWCLVNLAGVDEYQGRFEEMQQAADESVRVMGAALGEKHPSLIYGLGRGAVARAALGRPGAEELIRRGLAIQEEMLPAGHFERAVGETFLGRVLLLENRLAAAEQAFRRGLKIAQALSAGPRGLREGIGYFGEVLAREGKREEARPLIEQSLQSYEQVFGPDVWVTRMARQRLALLK